MNRVKISLNQFRIPVFCFLNSTCTRYGSLSRNECSGSPAAALIKGRWRLCRVHRSITAVVGVVTTTRGLAHADQLMRINAAT